MLDHLYNLLLGVRALFANLLCVSFTLFCCPGFFPLSIPVAPRVCLLDNDHSGNEVVPIAVGAALAVLVIIVLIAYLVGRVRNKKKSSYKALK